jgi:hypothetical protein
MEGLASDITFEPSTEDVGTEDASVTASTASLT